LYSCSVVSISCCEEEEEEEGSVDIDAIRKRRRCSGIGEGCDWLDERVY